MRSTKVYAGISNLIEFRGPGVQIRELGECHLYQRKQIPDEALNGALGVNSVNLFCCKQNALDLI